MPTVIYVDILLVVNFMINFILLRITALLLRRQPVFWRLCIAAVLGAFGALVIFVPLQNQLVLFTYRLLLTLGMTAAAFGIKSPRQLASGVFCLFTVSLLLSGLLLLWQLTVRPRGVLVAQGVVYFDIGAVALIVCCIVGYLIASLLSAMLARSVPKGALCEITVMNNGAVSVFPALIDTGSSLVEPFSHLPAIVCEAGALGRTLPEELQRFSFDSTTAQKVRLVPYKTLDSSGLLPAFLPELLMVRIQNEPARQLGDCYVAILNQSLGAADYRAVCNPRIMQYTTESGA